MKFLTWLKKDGDLVLVNPAHIVAAYEVGRETRITLTNGEAFFVALPLAQVQAQTEDALNSK